MVVSSVSGTNLAPQGTREVALEILRRRGIQGLYRGFGATALRELGFGAYFSTYEATLRFLSPSPHPHSDDPSSVISEANTAFATHSVPALLLAGGLAGVISWVSTFPFDVVKTRMQSTERIRANPYRTTLSTILASYRSEGLRVFVRGLSPTVIRYSIHSLPAVSRFLIFCAFLGLSRSTW